MKTQRAIIEAVALPRPEEVLSSGRAVVELGGIEQAGQSFEARVFLNNPGAGASTPMTPEAGYAGSFHVYGYGIAEASHANGGADQARLPMRRQVLATEAIARAARRGRSASVTVVAVPPGGGPTSPRGDEVPMPVGQVTIHT